ncbi:DNA utilization protein GntX [compost metagenome]
MNRSSVAYSASMRNWLAQYKYRGHEAYGAILARMIGRAMERMMQELHELHELNEHKAVHPFFDAVTYVPLSEERWRERGFNQAEVLAKGAVLAGKRLGGRLPVVGLLRRSRHTDKQSFKSRHERLHNMQGVFQALPEAAEQLAQAISPTQTYFRLHSPSHRRNTIRLLLVDDVYTTGSTVNACAAVLQHICRQLGMPGEIYSLTWARS